MYLHGLMVRINKYGFVNLVTIITAIAGVRGYTLPASGSQEI